MDSDHPSSSPEGYDPFTRELGVLEHTEAVIGSATGADPETLSRELALLAGEYRRLLRHLRHVTRISDRSQGRLQATSSRLDAELGRQVGQEIKEELLHGQGRGEGTKQQHLTIMFSDLRGFTTLAEQLTPDQVIRFLKSYYELSLDIVHRHGGFVKSFMGDGVMVVFGYNQIEHTSDEALACSLELLDRLGDFNAAQGTSIQVGVGLHSGPTAAGHIGNQDRSEFAVIGTTVNLASRIEAATKHYLVPLLFSREVLEILEAPPRPVRLVDTTSLRGQKGQVELYTFEGLPSWSSPARAR